MWSLRNLCLVTSTEHFATASANFSIGLVLLGIVNVEIDQLLRVVD